MAVQEWGGVGAKKQHKVAEHEVKEPRLTIICRLPWAVPKRGRRVCSP
jgi:hypothetical protein